MAPESEHFSIKTVEELQAKTTKIFLSYTEIGALLERKPSVIAQYARAGIIHPIQQGSKKLVSMEEVYLLDACLQAVERYNCSYTACKIIAALLKASDEPAYSYKNYLLSLEEEAGITKDEVEKYVNSYKHRGIFQKQKAEKSRKDIYSCSEYPAKN